MSRAALISVVVTTIVGSALSGGCECHGLAQDPNAEAEERRIDELMRKYRPPIPLSRAVGCDVCPAHCQHLDLSEEIAMPALMARFRAIAIDRPEQAETWNASLRLACIAGRQGPEAELEFLALLRDPSEPVRYYAASHALNLAFAIEEPIRVLREVGRGTASYAARAAARVVLWRQERDGDWPPNPHRFKRQQRPHVR
jgi:hypothetical protein